MPDKEGSTYFLEWKKDPLAREFGAVGRNLKTACLPEADIEEHERDFAVYGENSCGFPSVRKCSCPHLPNSCKLKNSLSITGVTSVYEGAQFR